MRLALALLLLPISADIPAEGQEGLPRLARFIDHLELDGPPDADGLVWHGSEGERSGDVGAR